MDVKRASVFTVSRTEVNMYFTWYVKYPMCLKCNVLLVPEVHLHFKQSTQLKYAILSSCQRKYCLCQMTIIFRLNDKYLLTKVLIQACISHQKNVNTYIF